MLHCAVIEVRQHLCCANVFLVFQPPLIDSESLKIVVDEDKVKLLQDSACRAEILVSRYFSFVANTFSNLIANAENVSFRISVKNVQIVEDDINDDRDSVQINLSENDCASIVCSNCDSVLITNEKYTKIREFPSGTIDISEFFCHHDHIFEEVLVPSTGEIFYGFLFIVLNRNTIENSTREKEEHIYCKRCLKYLGEIILKGKAVKIWCDSIRLNLSGQILEIFASDEISQIRRLLLKVIDETSLPSTEPLLRNMQFTKVLLRACFPNRQHQYLLLHILEKNLPVLRSEEFLEGKTTSTEEYHNTYELKQTKAFKILYRYILKDETNNDAKTTSGSTILNYWQQDINILKTNISPFLFSALNKELNKNAKILPEIYRLNTDSFLLSYIFY